MIFMKIDLKLTKMTRKNSQSDQLMISLTGRISQHRIDTNHYGRHHVLAHKNGLFKRICNEKKKQ